LNFAVDFILEGKYYEIINNLCTGWEVFIDRMFFAKKRTANRMVVLENDMTGICLLGAAGSIGTGTAALF
jgi:hypothetical protein